MTVRPARPEDRDAVLALLVAAGLPADLDAPTWVAEGDGGVVACARLHPLPDGAAELAGVAVAPGLRGRGVGARLVQELLRHAPPRTYALALAPGFFERHGFCRLPQVPEALAQKARGVCASTGFVPMLREA